MTEAFLGSGINVTMDTSGNVFFRRSDGGDIILQSFTAAQGSSVYGHQILVKEQLITLQREVLLQAQRAVTTTRLVAVAQVASSGSSTNSGTSIANMSIATQTGANDSNNDN